MSSPAWQCNTCTCTCTRTCERSLSLPARRTVVPENVLVGLDDHVRLGHLTSALDQYADRPSSRLGLLDYMAPEMMSVRAQAERDLSLAGVLGLWRGSSSCGDGGGSDARDAVERLVQSGWGDDAHEEVVRRGKEGEPDELGSTAAMAQAVRRLAETQAGSVNTWAAPSAPQRAAAHLQGQSPPESSPGSGRGSPAARPPSRSCGSGGSTGGAAGGDPPGASRSAGGTGAPCAAMWWEGRDYYNEKVDIWQVGCLVHELLCSSMPFEVCCGWWHSRWGQARRMDGICSWPLTLLPRHTFPWHVTPLQAACLRLTPALLHTSAPTPPSDDG
jgi:serine/threonine protein kinase